MAASILPANSPLARAAAEATACPFVGPAGRLLDHALAEAGIAREGVNVTDAVKHFKFALRGKRRIHQKPDRTEIIACKLWLDVERAEIHPRVTVLLGATAAQAVLGRLVTIGRKRGRPIPPTCGSRRGYKAPETACTAALPYCRSSRLMVKWARARWR